MWTRTNTHTQPEPYTTYPVVCHSPVPHSPPMTGPFPSSTHCQEVYGSAPPDWGRMDVSWHPLQRSDCDLQTELGGRRGQWGSPGVNTDSQPNKTPEPTFPLQGSHQSISLLFVLQFWEWSKQRELDMSNSIIKYFQRNFRAIEDQCLLNFNLERHVLLSQWRHFLYFPHVDIFILKKEVWKMIP